METLALIHTKSAFLISIFSKLFGDFHTDEYHFEVVYGITQNSLL